MARAEEVAHKRLVSKDSGFVGFQETVHGCIASYSSFAAAVLAGEADTITATEEALITRLLELETVQLRMQRQLDLASAERAHYDSVHSSIDAAVAATEEDIQSLKAKLQEERVNREHKQEYEALAERVCALPGRPELAKRQRAAEATLAFEQAELDKAAAALAARRQQFTLLMATIEDLQTALALQGTAQGSPPPPTSTAGEGSSDDGEEGDVSLA